jgi:hypothetical protein
MEFDHEQDVQPGQADRFDGEEVAGEGSGRLGTQELNPGRAAAAGRRPEAVAAQNGTHRRRGHPYAEFAAFADDAQTAPTRVLPGQPQHEVHYLGVQRPPGPTLGRVRPASADQLTVPAQQGRRRDQEDRPAIAGQQLRQRREDDSVGWGVAGPGHPSAQHQELMAEDRDLHILCVRRRTQADQAEELPDDHQRHGAHRFGCDRVRFDDARQTGDVSVATCAECVLPRGSRRGGRRGPSRCGPGRLRI